MSLLTNLDLLAVGLSVIFIVILGVVVFINNRKSITAQAFLSFSLLTVAYGVVNHLSYKATSIDAVLWLLRLTIFFAVWHAFSLFSLFYVFPDDKKKFSSKYKKFLLPLVFLTSLLNLSPFVFSGIDRMAPVGEVATATPGPGIAVFGLVTFGLVLAGIFLLVKKTLRAKGNDRRAFNAIFLGTVVTFSLLITFNLVFPIVFGVVRFVPFAPLFIFPFIAATAYAILRHGLFNVKVIATELLVFALWIFILLRALLSSSTQDRLINSSLFVFIVVVGVFLIRSVFKEVHQRERIEALVDEIGQSNDKLWVANEKLKELDRQKSEFVSIASHQLRSPLTSIKGYSSMLLEGSFGKITKKAEEAISRIFQSSQKLVIVIEDFLNISRIELGTMKYEMAEVDLKALTEGIVNEIRPTVERNNLKISFEAKALPAGTGNYSAQVDSGKIGQVVSNLIDNAMKYTRDGSIIVKLAKVEGRVRLSVTDTGIGIAPETMSKLFEKFSRANDASKVNIKGTGLGLYVAKQIVEAHKGKIWAESPGVGKGSTFIVEF